MILTRHRIVYFGTSIYYDSCVGIVCLKAALKIVKKQVFGVFVGFLGTILLVAQEFSFSATGDSKYSLLVVCASVFYGINVNILKDKLSGVSPMGIALGNFLMIEYALIHQYPKPKQNCLR